MEGEVGGGVGDEHTYDHTHATALMTTLTTALYDRAYEHTYDHTYDLTLWLHTYDRTILTARFRPHAYDRTITTTHLGPHLWPHYDCTLWPHFTTALTVHLRPHLWLHTCDPALTTNSDCLVSKAFWHNEVLLDVMAYLLTSQRTSWCTFWYYNVLVMTYFVDLMNKQYSSREGK